MPNWCSNKAIIKFPTVKAAKKFIKICTPVPERPIPGAFFAKTPQYEPEPLNTYYPMPEGLMEGGKWYDWCIENWGTKWEIEINNLNLVDQRTIDLAFESAWGPPVQWFTHCGIVHKWKWGLQYIEPGSGFGGTIEGNSEGAYLAEQFEDGDSYYKQFGKEVFGIQWEDDDDVDEPTP